MILPMRQSTSSITHLLFPRQAIPPPDDDSSPAEDDPPKTTRTTTVNPTAISTSTSTKDSTAPESSSTSILDRAKESTNLEWWQLLCIALGGALVLILGVWIFWRARRRKSAEVKQAKEVRDEEEKRLQEMLEQKSKEASEEVEDEAEEGEGWDSVSDGGTIYHRRKGKKREDRGRGRSGSGGRGRGGRGRGRRSGSDTETDSMSESESDWSSSSESGLSDRTYYDRYRRPRRDRHTRDRRRHRRDRDRDHRDRRTKGRDRDRYDRHRRSYSPSPSPTPLPPVPPLPRPTPLRKKRETNFRDSVFSSYTSMKAAAVKLKHVEAKVKLKKALENEEKLEQARRDKVREANKEIEMANRRMHSGESDRPLIPPARPQTTSSSGGSTASSARYPTPPPRLARRGDSTTSSYSSRFPPPHNPPTPSKKTTPPAQSRPTQPKRKESGLNGEIQDLLGGGSRPIPQSKETKPPIVKKASVDNAFQATWLARPDPAFSVPQSARSGSVYLPVTKPRDRPMIPPGGLAPAPPPKVRLKQSPGVGQMGSSGLGTVAAGGGGAGGGKWADRLRSRK